MEQRLKRSGQESYLLTLRMLQDAPPEAASPEAAYAVPRAPQAPQAPFGGRLLLQRLFSLRFSAHPLSSRYLMESVRLPSRSCHFLR